MSRETCDVLIVGGGPAGSSCARRLVRGGLSVTILDRATFPRPKLCAGWITPPLVSDLGLSLAEYAEGRTLQPISGFRTGMMGGPAVTTAYRAPVSYAIRRTEFDHYLLARSGAATFLGEAVATIAREGRGWVVNDRIRAPVLVGAGGHFCPVARAISAPRPGTREVIVAAQEVEFALDDSDRQSLPAAAGVPELYFSRDLAGYGWLVRKGDFLNIGFGRVGSAHLRGHVQGFVDFLREHGRLPRGTPASWPGHAYLLYETTTRPLLTDGVLLVGDAAGLAYGESGEGIRPAVESGLMAADTILEAGERYDRSRLEAYRDRLTARFGPPGSRRAPFRLLPGFVRRGLAARLLGTAWFTRSVVLDRWFLHRTVGPLFPPSPDPAPADGRGA